MNDIIVYAVINSISFITFKTPPVNALGTDLRTAIFDGLAKANSTDDVTAIILQGSGRCFSGGADIREFGLPPASPSLRDLIDRIEASPKPVIAAIHGVCFGGGLELSLACHYRIGDGSAKVAFPEIKLGLIPGAGGTQRLPRITGVDAALNMILSGNPIDGEAAGKMGVLDKVFEGNLENSAIEFASSVSDLPKTRDIETDPPEDGFFDSERKKMERRGRGLIAPWRCIDSVENAVTLPIDEGLAKERDYFNECLASDQSKAQRHIFFAEREVTKIPDIPKDTPAKSIESVVIIGCGTMGGGIGMNFANAGISVHFIETSDKALDKDFMRDYLNRNKASFEMDVHIWKHKRFEYHPVLCDGDGPLHKMRQWYNQFYLPKSPKQQQF